ncbi:MAG: sigma 54-interacting transcriptional regulator [Polyangiales bacterium]
MPQVIDYAADLKAIASMSTQPDALSRTLGNVLQGLGQLISYDLAVLYRLDDARLKPVAKAGALASDLPADHQLELRDFPSIQRVLDHGRPSAQTEEHHSSHEGDPYDGVLDFPHGHSCMLIPLRTADEAVGVITLDRRVCQTYTDAELGLADVYGQLTSTALMFSDQAELLGRYRRQLEARNGIHDEHKNAHFCTWLERSRSPSMVHFAKLAQQVAKTTLPIVIRGETGSGKEVVARALHQWSGRQAGPFVSVNCAAIPENLVESELFGHVKGAFSGALRDRPGRFVAANGGTLFLDEIGDMPLMAQAKLLRALQEGSFEAVGSDRTTRVDVRVIAASHVDLEAAIEAGRFREDLFFRLAAVPLFLPPLRERCEDILDLTRGRLEELARRDGKDPWTLAPCAVDFLKTHSWPGNIRELLYAVERAAALAPTSRIRREHFGEAKHSTAPAPEPQNASELLSFAEAERRHLARALELSAGKVYGPDGAASILGLRPTTLQAKLKKHGLK